jgi:hypothetical protein
MIALFFNHSTGREREVKSGEQPRDGNQELFIQLHPACNIIYAARIG